MPINIQAMEAPLIEALEYRWKGRDHWRYLALIAVTPIFLILMYYTHKLIWAESTDRDDWRVFLAYFLPATLYLFALVPFALDIKNFLVERIIRDLGWNYKPRKDRTQREAKNLGCFLFQHGLIPKFNIAGFDDTIEGFHEGHAFDFHELTLFHQPFGSKSLHTVFQGGVFVFYLSYPGAGTTILTRNPHRQLPRHETGVKHKGVYQDQNGDVTVFMSDPSVMNFLICERFRQALLELEHELEDYDISCVLKHDRLFIPIAMKNLFQVTGIAHKNMADSSHVKSMLNDFSEMLRIVDTILKRRYCQQSHTFSPPRIVS